MAAVEYFPAMYSVSKAVFIDAVSILSASKQVIAFFCGEMNCCDVKDSYGVMR